MEGSMAIAFNSDKSKCEFTAIKAVHKFSEVDSGWTTGVWTKDFTLDFEIEDVNKTVIVGSVIPEFGNGAWAALQGTWFLTTAGSPSELWFQLYVNSSTAVDLTFEATIIEFY